jgi:hypothetical protein
MLPESGRTEKRTKVAVEVRLLSLQSPGIIEDTQMDNVSPRGARVLTTQPLQPQEPLLVASTDGTLQTYARVVYCKRLPDQRYAVGLQFERGA